MAETTTVENGKPKKEQVARHTLLLPDGTETKDIHTATGIKYQDVSSGEVFTYQVPGATAGSPQTMLAVFGAKTKATNEASQIRQIERAGEDPECSQVDNIIEAFSKIDKGIWREPSEGGVGAAKVDRDSLALAIVEAQKALGNDRDLNAVRAKLDADPKFFRGARQAKDVTAIYNTLVGKETTPKTSADLAF